MKSLILSLLMIGPIFLMAESREGSLLTTMTMNGSTVSKLSQAIVDYHLWEEDPVKYRHQVEKAIDKISELPESQQEEIINMRSATGFTHLCKIIQNFSTGRIKDDFTLESLVNSLTAVNSLDVNAACISNNENTAVQWLEASYLAHNNSGGGQSILNVTVRLIEKGVSYTPAPLIGDRSNIFAKHLIHIFMDRGEYSRVQSMVAAGVSPDAKSTEGDSLLHNAGDEELKQRFLFSLGADLESTDSDGLTPLLSYIIKGKDITLLIKLGADIEAGDPVSGKKAVHFAVEGGTVYTLQQLAEASADMSAKDASGNTPFCMAMINGSLGMAEVLIELGAEPDVTQCPNSGFDQERVNQLFGERTLSYQEREELREKIRREREAKRRGGLP